MKVQFPAMKGMIGQRTYYACLMNLSAIPKMFTFQDWIEFRPEDREQRVLNRKRVGDTLDLTVYRSGHTQRVPVKVGEAPQTL